MAPYAKPPLILDEGRARRNIERMAALARCVSAPADIWIKINVGANRAGADWNDTALLARICRETNRHGSLRLRGLLTHNGRTYGARSFDALARLHADAMKKMRRAFEQPARRLRRRRRDPPR